MPIKIDDSLPARQILESENIFVMTESRAIHQDIRPLRIVLLNLMPLKISTETHILRMLSNSPLQIEIDLLMMSTYESTNTPKEHLTSFYKTFDDLKNNKYDGMIITGAPVEQMEFEEVIYWKEMQTIMDWSKHNVTSVFHICWGAQAGLYHHFGIQKHPLEKKMFGVFPHTVTDRNEPLLRGFDDIFTAPHSRHTGISIQDIDKNPNVKLLSASIDAGAYIVMSSDRRMIFVTGHSEYDPNTLADEYFRDLNKGLPIEMPQNYFPNNNPSQAPLVGWRSHAHLLYSNWLNYFVYQQTPYRLEEIS